MNKDRLIPSIRFSGFTSDWEWRKLEDVLKVNSGRDYKHLSKGNIPVYGTGGYMLSVDSKLSEVDGVGIGRKGTIDKPQYLKAPFWTVDTLFYLTALSGNDLSFFYSMSQNINWKRMDESTGVPSLSKRVIEKVAQTFPSLEEQQKIGLFFKKLDETITLQQQLLSDYKQLKKAMLQQLFPQKGETVPKVRFAGFSGDWKKTKLKSAIENEFKGKTQLSKLSKGLVEYLDTERLNGGKPYLSNGEQNVSEEDILILWDGSKAGTIYKGFKGSLGSTLKAYTINSKNNSEFIYQFLKHKEKVIYINYRTPNIPHVVKDFSDVFPIIIPCYEEQEIIGHFFKKLDETIGGHEQKLATYQELKKALLQRMFV